jgi:hypothetical protein
MLLSPPMHLSNILSVRFHETLASYQVIYEWEDDLSKHLGVPITNALPVSRRAIFNKHTRRIVSPLGPVAAERLNELAELHKIVRKGNGLNLVFELHNQTIHNFSTSSRSIPVMIDLWKTTDFNLFFRLYRNCKLVLISSLETFNYLKSIDCPLNIAHFPLFLADKYKLLPGTRYPKTYDIVLAGRSNPVLSSYLDAFIAKFPEVEIVSPVETASGTQYVSNKKGIIGKFENRSDYMNLLRSGKISFYSTPGIDGGEKRTGGLNPVTPRFLELLSAQCLLLGRYPQNEETEFYELKDVCPNVGSYEVFEETLLNFLHNKQPDFSHHQRILNKHLSQGRAKLLLQALKLLTA